VIGVWVIEGVSIVLFVAALYLVLILLGARLLVFVLLRAGLLVLVLLRTWFLIPAHAKHKQSNEIRDLLVSEI
jgi:hypothetical protein